MDKEIVKKTIWRNNRRAKCLEGPFVLMDDKVLIKVVNLYSNNKDILGEYDYLAVVCSVQGFIKVQFLKRQDANKLLNKDAKIPYIRPFFSVIP